MNTCAYGSGSHCWVSCVLMAVAWWLVSSGLLFLTWNKVVAAMTKVKSAKYWQALLLVATICVFCAPRYYAMSRSRSSCCHEQQKCHEMKKGPCPYSGNQVDHDDDVESDKAESKPAKK